jgi:hypothetical protein
MGMTTVLYGYIYASGEAAEMNAARIASLPDDDKIIYLTLTSSRSQMCM